MTVNLISTYVHDSVAFVEVRHALSLTTNLIPKISPDLDLDLDLDVSTTVFIIETFWLVDPSRERHHCIL